MKTNIDTTALPYPDKSPNMLSGVTSIVSDRSRFTISEIGNCATPAKEEPIQVVSYYASLKNSVVNQWGQIYSYETIDTGYQYIINSPNSTTTVFGGDTFISRFAFKTKLPFFIDNRVNAPDDSDIFYDEIGNVAYPRYWHSARSILENYSIPGQGVMSNIISYKAHNFDCPNEVGTDVIVSTSTTTTTSTTFPPGGSGGVTPSSTITYYDGYFYLFAYGIPNFYCESSYNVDLRQAFNNREGDFWPHVSTDIPDDWLQQSFVPIAQDNTYYYNTTFSKQNRENTFTHLPPDWEQKFCFTNYPFRAIYSDAQNIDADNRVNNWLIYRAISYFDFPQNYGNLVALDGIQNKAILARFANKTLMYNNLLTIDTSNPQAAYVGNPLLFRGAPPIDFAETDLGYVGSQHKMLLKIPQGQVTVDAKRGQVFLIQGTEAVDLSGFGSGMNRFFVEHLPFMIYKSFPEVNIDNHFKGIGLHGVYDSVYDRVIITKLDYAPKSKDILYDPVEQEFYINNVVNGLTIRQTVNVSDERYFCNVSWTLSFNMNTKSWISFHSYIPNWYVAENNFFYSGQNNCCEDFDFLVGTLVPNPSTTTTTSTSTSSTTTTTTTVAPLQCNITATVIEINCSLAGIGQIVSLDCTLVGPTTTTTSTSTSTTSTTSTSTTSTTSTSTTTSTTSSTTTTTTTAEPTTTTTTTTGEPTTTTTTSSTSSTTTTTTTPSPTTTTTTTPSPTTTTTTTPAPTAECYKLDSAPVGGCTFVYKDENGATITVNISSEDAGLCFIECVTEVISDDCGFLAQGVGCLDPQCDCSPPPTTTSTSTTSTTTTSTTSSSTTTTTTTAAPVTTTTTTTVACSCFSYDVIIGQDDLDDATGNTDPGKDNGIVYVSYTNCSGTPAIAQYSLAGTFLDNICVDTNAPSPTIYYYKNNTQTAPSTSSISITANDCCVS